MSSHITTGIRSILHIPLIFNTFNQIIGANRFRRHYVTQFVQPQKQSRILDIGCGTAEILDFLPKEIDYVGYDLEADYIAYAKEKYKDRGNFYCRLVNELTLEKQSTFDIVLASALLHHLDDEEAGQLVRIAKQALKPDGYLVTFDNVITERQSPIERFLIRQDRGCHVRNEAEYRVIAESAFPRVESTVLHHLLRIPYTHVFMKCFSY